MGTAGHSGLHVYNVTGDALKAVAAVRAKYAELPEGFDEYDWRIEEETVATLVYNYAWAWANAEIQVLRSEFNFEIPLVNPETGKPSTVFRRGGKIDGIVQMEDDRLAVKESKFLSEDVSDDSDLWKRLQFDGQISGYVDAARSMGFDVVTCLYDVIRKPAIKPEAVPLLDDDGLKVVLDQNGERVRTKDGKKWRQTSGKDEETGAVYTLQSRPMTPEEWAEKLAADIGQRVDFYYARKEIPRLDQELDEYRTELWDLQQTIREAQRNNRWFRTVERSTCSMCPFFWLCAIKFDPATSPPPEGFEIVQDVHPELLEDAD